MKKTAPEPETSALPEGQLQLLRDMKALHELQRAEQSMREAVMLRSWPGQLTDHGLARDKAKEHAARAMAYMGGMLDDKLRLHAEAERAALNYKEPTK